MGTCSLCQGPVTAEPLALYPRIRCERCGARAAHGFGPKIEMVPDPTSYQARLAELERVDRAAVERDAVPVTLPRGKAERFR